MSGYCHVVSPLYPGIYPINTRCRYLFSNFDGARVELMFAGNRYIGDIWRFDGTDWVDLKPAGPAPSIRGRLAGEWDLIRQRLVIFGGQGPTGALGDTWEYDKATNTWTQVTPTDVAASST